MTERVDFTNVAINVITIVITALVGGLIGYFSARRISTLNTKQTACAELRKAFTPLHTELRFLDWVHTRTISHLFKDSFVSHSIAIDQFRLYISGKQRRDFNKAWQNYYGHDDPRLEQIADQLTDILNFGKYDKDSDSNGRDTAIKNIEAILAFTESQKPNWFFCPFKKEK